VTEYIYTGLTVRALAEAARTAGNEVDIAAVSVEQVDAKLPEGVRVFQGTKGKEGRKLFEFTLEAERDELIGVKKAEDLPSWNAKQNKEPVIFAKVNPDAELPLMAMGRKVMKYLAEECAKKLREEKATE
jgi:hypothetical protein